MLQSSCMNAMAIRPFIMEVLKKTMDCFSRNIYISVHEIWLHHVGDHNSIFFLDNWIQLGVEHLLSFLWLPLIKCNKSTPCCACQVKINLRTNPCKTISISMCDDPFMPVTWIHSWHTTSVLITPVCEPLR